VKLAVPIACIVFAAVVVWVSLVAWPRKTDLPKVATTPLEELHPKVSYAELSDATNGFSPGNLIGDGSHGSVYRGTMLHEGSERTVAVKVLRLRQRGAPATFAAECEALRHARHRNLVRILTVCASVDREGEDFKALVYGYMPNGSLESWLHPEPREDGGGGGGSTLTLLQRLNAALDVASALDYLHNDCEVPIAHCDLKPSNVLLDGDMVAHVGDFGLARLLDSAERSGRSSTAILNGSIGYIAPGK
jgi:serine/threonine protein kinase